ncbi:PD-(D/E)XK nuclease family protein [Natroniella acetigena]|uniref:PD-(D/E)XK nuclease family protein n=1 Tax=Natroniella acetigena TaxID=52004 RepID=UPI00200B16B8|nr:PD-(D/E)XK nuclease family protein [Natroniella acetigena]MCK8826574.1 PD-(D/E)XK nuclease family protein [Natroniella acetigena]
MFWDVEGSIFSKYNQLKNTAIKKSKEVLKGNVLRKEDKILEEIILNGWKESSREFVNRNEEVKYRLAAIANKLENNTIFKEALKVSSEIILLDKDEPISVDLFNTKFYANIDLLLKLKESGKYILVDWKTGSSNIKRDKKQLLLYALFILNKFPEVKIDDICNSVFIAAYLQNQKRFSYNIKKKELKKFEQEIKEQFNLFHNKLQKLEENIPLPIGKFKRRSKDSYCNYCNMRKVCFKLDKEI